MDSLRALAPLPPHIDARPRSTPLAACAEAPLDAVTLNSPAAPLAHAPASVHRPSPAALPAGASVLGLSTAALPGVPPGVLILLRHGHSVWNLENRFTGLADVPLAPSGKEDARRAGHELRNIRIDAAYTSMLQRARNTAELALDAAGQPHVPLIETAILNDRNYGDIQGRNRDELTAAFGKPQVDRWRHSYSERPPNGDSIADLADRVVPYFNTEIAPRLRAGENVLVTGHCDSLRALMVHLEQLNDDDVPYIANGQPIVYTFDDALRVASRSASQAAHTV